ncbi:MAG: hypothetical protein WA399_07785 [Acidobacteriaceae bacterium]
MKRPLAVTFVGWLYLVVNVIGLARHYSDVLPPHHIEDLWIDLLRIIGVLAGAFLLRGAFWAPWLAIAWMAFHVWVGWLNGRIPGLVHSGFFLLILYLLFLRPDSRAWFRARFRPRAKTTDLTAGP